MLSSRFVDRAEFAWGQMCRENGSVFAQAFRLVLAAPGRYGLFALFIFFIRKSSRLFSIENMTGAILHVTWWAYSIAVQLVTLGVMLSVILMAISRMRGGEMAVGKDITVRMGRAFPYTFCLIFMFDQIYGVLAWGFVLLGDMVLGPEWSHFPFSVSCFLGALPFLFLLSRFGFTIVGPAVEEQVSFKASWQLSSPVAGALFLTTLFWWGAKKFPAEFLVYFPYPHLTKFYFDWLHMPIQACVTVFFGIVSAVWYERLRLAD